MNRKSQFISICLLLVTFQSYAFDCESLTNGFGSDASTWIKCSGSLSSTDNKVTIESGSAAGKKEEQLAVNDVVSILAHSRYYVNANSAAPTDGLSWDNAFANLQDALAVAVFGDEIWVAQGVYYPDEGGSQVNNDTNASFTLVDGVTVFGGFDGTESDLNLRNPDINLTILSGDIGQDDVNVDGNFITESISQIINANSTRIINAEAVTASSVINGFTVTSGSAEGNPIAFRDLGAGIYCGFDDTQLVGPTLNQVHFIGNKAARGAAIYGCTQTIINASFINNYATERGGAIFALGGQFANVVFSGNESLKRAGALNNVVETATFTNVTFIGNYARQDEGGGIYSKVDIVLENVLFSGNRSGINNSATEKGGGLYLNNGHAELTNVTFSGNSAGFTGGAISVSAASTIDVKNTIIWNNIDQTGIGTTSASIDVIGGVIVPLSNSLVQGYGNAGNNLDQDPLFLIDTDPTSSPTVVGNTHLNMGSAAINSGDNSFVTTGVDLDGYTRINDVTVDMGAFEFGEIQATYVINVTLNTPYFGGFPLILQNNSADDLTLQMTGQHVFSEPQFNGASYSVSVLPTMVGLSCVVTNGDGIVNGADVNVLIDCNTQPTVMSDSYTTLEDVDLIINDPALGVLANDLDNEDVLFIANPGAFNTTGLIGNININADGTFSFTPPNNGNGTASFTFDVSDGIQTVSSSLTIDVQAVNDPPTVTESHYTTQENTMLTVSNAAVDGVLANANVDMDTLYIVNPGSFSTTGLVGSLNIAADGTFTFIPPADSIGTATFAFEVSDGVSTVTSTLNIDVLGNVIFVNEQALPGGDGSVWNKAFSNIQDALLVATAGQSIWVAQGVYYPDEGGTQVNNDRTASFTLIDGVNLYGGFNGTEVQLNQQNPDMNVTILSGDITKDDVNDDGNFITESTDDIVFPNSYHIINGQGLSNLTIIDGFTVSSGYSISILSLTGEGAGIYCDLGTTGLNVNQIKFIGNRSDKGGAAMYGCTDSIKNSSFFNNKSNASGAAIYSSGGYLENVEFIGNSASTSAGAIYNVDSAVTLINAKFISNDATDNRGGAIYSFGALNIENALFSGNSSNTQNVGRALGGAIYLTDQHSDFTNVTFTGNRAGRFGGAISISGTASLLIKNSIIWNNLDRDSVGPATTTTASIEVQTGATVNRINSLIQGFGTSGVGNLDEDPLFITDTDPSTAPTTSGNARLQLDSMAIDAGDNSFVTPGIKDLGGNNRILNATVDMGAYESISYTVSVNVTGLGAGSLVLQNKGADNLTITDNGTQAFTTPVAQTDDYLVTVLSQPTSPNQQCVITSGNEMGVVTANVLITVECTTIKYKVGVDVTGLATGGSLSLLNNAETLEITSNGLSNFATALDDLSAYAVSITSQPSSPNQQCLITSNNASGNLSGADKVITIECTTLQYTVGVNVLGLANGVTLSVLNNAETLEITSNGLSNFATALDDLSIYAVSITAQPSSPNQQCLITSNNASGNLSGVNEVINIQCTTLQYTVGVNVSGLANGGSLSLLNNAETLEITSNGLSNFATALDDLSIYAVSITAQPSSPNQQCLITSNNASGNLSGADKVITIECTTLQYTVGVNVLGLANGVTLSVLNNAETLEITSNGLSNFATALDDLSIYAVSITSQPSSPNQQCLITSNNASGNLSGADKVITIECTTLQYTIGVNVSGLASGNTVGFENNGEGLSVSVDGQFDFSTALDDGSTYEVTVTSQPTTPNQMCSVVSNTGSLSGSDVLLIVTCTTNQYFVGGMASGLAGGNTVTLSLGAQDLDISNNAAFVFLNPLSDESDYFVSVLNQPTVPNQTCDLVNPTGTIAGNDVTDIEVNCITNQYTVGGTMAGLHLGNNLVIQNNNSDDLTITNSGNFDFVTAIDDLQSYNATILSQPNNPIQPCVISNNTGNVSGSNVISVSIVCEFGNDLIYSGGFE